MADEWTYFLRSIPPPGRKAYPTCDYCRRHRTEHREDGRCPIPNCTLGGPPAGAVPVFGADVSHDGTATVEGYRTPDGVTYITKQTHTPPASGHGGYKCIDCKAPMGGRMGPHDTVTGYGQCSACQDKPAKGVSVSFSDLRILVLGDIFLDEYQFGECTRISQEAPVPIVKIDHTKTKRMLGGAGNVAANIRALGGQCTIGTMIGADYAGATLNELLRARSITRLHPSYTPSTNVKTRIVAQNQQVVRLDKEEDTWSADAHMENILEFIPLCDAIILSDYAKGYLNRENVEGIISEAKRHKKLVVVDTKPCNVGWFHGADWFTPNLKEYGEMRGLPYESNVLITKGAEGMQCQYGTTFFDVPAIRREVVDVAGAGDTVTAAFTLALAAKMPIREAVEFANKAAGVVVGKQGTSTVTIKEIESLEAEIHGLRV